MKARIAGHKDVMLYYRAYPDGLSPRDRNQVAHLIRAMRDNAGEKS